MNALSLELFTTGSLDIFGHASTVDLDKRICQIFIKGCTTEDYSRLFGAADYIEHNAVCPITGVANMCDLDEYSIG